MRIVLLALSVLMITASGAYSQTSQEVSCTKDGLEFTLSLEKSEYVFCEPITAKLTVTNVSDKPLRIAEPTGASWITTFPVKHLSGDEKPQLQTNEIDIMGVEDDYGWVYEPGESISYSGSVKEPYTGWLPVGTYSVAAVYKIPYGVKDVVQVNITTPPLSFTIVEPKGVDATAAAKWQTAMKLSGDGRTIAQAIPVFAELKNPEKGGVFAQYAWSNELACLFSSGERDKAIELWREYIQQHPDVSVGGLAGRLFISARYEEAKKYYSQMKNQYERQERMRLCDRRQAEKEAK